MQHSFEHYTFRLAEKLGWSQRVLVQSMSAEEIIDWMAFELTNSPEFRDKIEKIPLALGPEEEAAAIKRMFMGLGGDR